MKRYRRNEFNKEKIITIAFLVIILWMIISFINDGYKDMGEKLEDIYTNNELSLYEKIKNTTNQAENIINDNISNKEQFVSIYGLVQKIVGKMVIEDKNDRTRDIVKLKNNMITFIQNKQEMADKANKIVELNKKLENLNIPFIYVQAPYKVKSKDYLPTGIEDYSNQNADELLEILNNNGVYNIDLRKIFEDKNLEDEFFITDHHWKIETAFEAANYITDNLNRYFNFNIDDYYTDIKNYNNLRQEKPFLGSIGKRIGKYYAGTDTFNFLVPNFNTEMKVNNIIEGKVLEGDFEETIISKKFFEGNDITDNQYACYLGGDYPEIIINNNNLSSDKKILVIQDSFGLPFSAMMSLRVKELRILDLRHFDSAELEYIAGYNPDIVIIIYNPSSFYIEKIFEFE